MQMAIPMRFGKARPKPKDCTNSEAAVSTVKWPQHKGSVQMPRMLPESSTSMEEARETLGSPGISIMLPEIATT